MLKNKTEDLENVQKNAARFITNGFDYTAGSTSTNMQTIRCISHEEFRARIKTAILYKRINKLIDIPFDNYQKYCLNIDIRHNKRQNLRLRLQALLLPQFLYSGLNMMWNKIPDFRYFDT